MKTLLLCSGGADSSTLLYKLYNEGAEHIRCIFVQYGAKQNDRESQPLRWQEQGCLIQIVWIIETHVKSF